MKSGSGPSSGRSARDYAALDGPNSMLTGEIERNAKNGNGNKPSYGPSF